MTTLAMILPVLSLLIGLFVGAWLTHRAGRNMSPLPECAFRNKIRVVDDQPKPTQRKEVSIGA